MKHLMGVMINVMFCLMMTASLLGCDEEAMSSPAEHEDMTILTETSMAAPRENYPVVAENTSQAKEAEPETHLLTLDGTITDISYDTAQVTIEDDSGQQVILKAGPEIDLKSFREGDQIRSEYNSDMLVKSLTRTNQN